MFDPPPLAPNDDTLSAILRHLQRLEERLDRLESKVGTGGPLPESPPRDTATRTPVRASPGFTPAHPPVAINPARVALPAELRSTGAVAPAPASPPIATPSITAPPPVHTPARAASETKAEALRSLSGHRQTDTSPTATPAIAPAESLPTAPPVAKLQEFSTPRTPAKARAPKPSINLEWIIGTKGLAAAGALAVVIGVIFFLKYAVEQGWIGKLPPLFRCLCGVAFGGALVAAGEAARRKINALAGAGLYAAGIACAYASVYAGYGYFTPPVISQSIAFIALVLISALGIALSASTRLASVAIVSLVGAYLAPFLLRADNPNPLVFPVYAGALLATGLILSAWLRGQFRWVGRSVWWATMIIGGAWAAFTLGERPLVVIVFVLAVWAMIHASHIVAARGQTVSDDQRDAPPPKASFTASGPMLSSFSVTGWTGILLTLALRTINPSLDWLAPCGLTAATGALAVWLAGHLGVVRNRPRTDAERLGASLALQSAGALIGTVALATSSAGPAAALLWLCMGVGAIAAGRWGRALALIVYGNVLLVIGSARLVLWDSWHAALFSSSVAALGVLLTPWTAWMTLAAAAWIGAAVIVSLGTPSEKRSIYGSILAAFGVLLLCGAFINAASSGVATTYVYIVLPIVILGAHKLRPQLTLNWVSFVLLSIVTVKVALLDALVGRIPSGATRLLSLPLTPAMGLCCALGVSWGALALSARSRIGRDPSALRRARVFTVVTLAMLMLAPMNQDAEAAHLVWPWAIVAALAAVASRLEPRLQLRMLSLLIAIVTSVAWLAGYVLFPGFAHWSIQPAPLAHPGLIGALVIVIAATLAARIGRPRDDEAESFHFVSPVGLTVAAAMLWVSTSFEASRIAEIVTGSPAARGATVSVWWGLLAVGLLWLGFRRAAAGVRYVGLTLLGLAGVKIVLFDMAHAPQLARVAGFVSLGLLMLGTAVGYARVTKSLEARKEATRPPGNGVG